jgi:hypothetical protein
MSPNFPSFNSNGRLFLVTIEKNRHILSGAETPSIVRAFFKTARTERTKNNLAPERAKLSDKTLFLL